MRVGPEGIYTGRPRGFGTFAEGAVGIGSDEHDRRPEPYPDPATTTPEKVLLIQAHPDDAEFSCSGTIAKWAKAGAEIPEGGYHGEYIREIAERKFDDLNANDLDQASKIIAGTARSMGVEVER